MRYSFKELSWVWCFLRVYSSHRLLGGEKYEQRHPHSDSNVLNSEVDRIRSGSCFSTKVKYVYLLGRLLEALRWKGLFGRRLTAERTPTGGSKVGDMRAKKTPTGGSNVDEMKTKKTPTGGPRCEPTWGQSPPMGRATSQKQKRVNVGAGRPYTMLFIALLVLSYFGIFAACLAQEREASSFGYCLSAEGAMPAPWSLTPKAGSAANRPDSVPPPKWGSSGGRSNVSLEPPSKARSAIRAVSAPRSEASRSTSLPREPTPYKALPAAAMRLQGRSAGSTHRSMAEVEPPYVPVLLTPRADAAEDLVTSIMLQEGPGAAEDPAAT